MTLRKWAIFSVVIALLVIGCAISGSAASSKFAAKVNGVGIKAKTLDAAVSNFIENQKVSGIEIKEEEKVKLREGILEQLISAELLYQESKKAKLGDLKEKIKERLEEIKKGFASEDEFKNLLKDRGISEKDLKEDIKKGVYIDAFLEKDVYSSVVISDQERKAEYEKNKERLNLPEQVKASHILIRFEEAAGDEDKASARTKIDDLRKRAVSGEDFAELAKENSEDGSAPQGGDLGYFRRGMMVPPFEAAAFSLDTGKISDVVETQFGYHIIKVLDKQDARQLNYEEVEPDMSRFLIGQRRDAALKELVDSLKENAKIKMY